MSADVPLFYQSKQEKGHRLPSAEAWLASLSLPPRLVDVPDCEKLMPASRVEAFRAAWARAGKEPGVVDKVVNNIRYITPELFNQGVHAMAKAVNGFVGDDPYYMVIDSKQKSGGYMVGLVSPTLSHKPERIEEGLFGALDKDTNITDATKVVILDDATYSGSYATTIYNEVRTAYPRLDPKNILLAHVGMTSLALKNLQQAIEDGVQLHATYKIPVLPEILTHDEMQQVKIESSWAGIKDFSVLTFLPFRVPDNFCGDFRASVSSRFGGHTEYFLIDDSSATGIYPPYRKRRRNTWFA